MRKILALLILTSCSAFAQFTTTAKHITQGTSLPATCSPLSGDIFFIKSGGGLGPYYCSAVNTWSAITGSSVGNAFSVLTGGTNITAAMVVGAGASLDFTSTGIINASKINGNPLGSTTPTTTNILIADGTNWITRTVSGDITISNTGVVAIGSAKVTNTMLAGSIDASTKFTNATPIANGGTGQATQQAGFDALAPTATVAGSIIYWNGTHWVKLDGNASGTNFLQENASGVPSWAAAGGGTPCTTTALSIQFNNAGAFGCATALTYVAGTNTLLGSASLNVDWSAIASFSAPAVFIRSDTAFTMTAGQAIIANPSASVAGFKITTGTISGLTMTTGVFFCSATPICGYADGTNAQALVTILGSGAAYTLPSAGVAHFAGSTNQITSSSVISTDMAIVNTRRSCTMVVGSNNGAALVDADIGPQGNQCFVPFAATVVEVDVNADAGTPNVIPRVRHCSTYSGGVCTVWTTADLTSSALAAAASNFDACSKTSATTGLDGGTTCSATLQNTSIAIGDWIELKSGTAGGTAKRLTITVIYTVN